MHPVRFHNGAISAKQPDGTFKEKCKHCAFVFVADTMALLCREGRIIIPGAPWHGADWTFAPPCSSAFPEG